MNQELIPNLKLSHYRIVSKIGAGGMGEVYRARDTRLDREVAIKVLPADFANDADRLKRFEQEARATSALNHPNILTVYDIGTHEGAPFMVAELLDGEELRSQLEEGAIAPKKAIDYAQQITAGLAAAHEKGIVHRDLKPENLFVTKDGRVKILDFGLAKLKPQKLTGGVDSEGETMKPLTNPGVVMGTVGYMSPEQVRGAEVDHRSDIFSFGMILYEMLSGKRAFDGTSMAELMSAILKEEPSDLSETNAKISPQLDKIMRRCLEKKPERRFQTASDLGFALEALASAGYARVLAGRSGEEASSIPMGESQGQHAGTRAYPAGRERVAWLVAGVAVLAALVFAVAYFRRAPAESRATYTWLPWPEKTTAQTGAPVISPDGRRIAITAATNGIRHIWVYSLDAPEPKLLEGTDSAQFPFWSPDGRHIGFLGSGRLRKIQVSGGMSEILCDAPQGWGGSWSSKGEILFAPAQLGSGLNRVSDKGGTPTPVTRLDVTRLETGHNFPRFLPDGHHFLFFVTSERPENTGIRIGSLDKPQTTFLVRSDTNAEYSSAGYLIFMRGRKILAQRFNAETLTISGDPTTLVERANFVPYPYTPLSVLDDKLLLYQAGVDPNSQLAWFDRNGNQLSSVGQPGEFETLHLSPDGERVIIEKRDPQNGSRDLWSLDLARETLNRITASPSGANSPLWSPDGKRIAFRSFREGSYPILQKEFESSNAAEEILLNDNSRSSLYDWSSDGRFIVYSKMEDKTSVDLWLLPLFGDRQPKPYLVTPFWEAWGKVSPDGRWLAYRSNESGRHEVYVQSFPESGRKVRVSKSGGRYPRWRRDGRELYFISADDKLMAVPVMTEPNFTAGTPQALFDVGSYSHVSNGYVYDVSADGKKILLQRPLEDNSQRPLTVVQNWTELLKK